MKTLLLMRHGDAPANVSDSQRMLSELGKNQCVEMSELLNDFDVERLLTSDYQRAVDSADIVTADIGSSLIKNQTENLRPTSDPEKAIEDVLEEIELLDDRGSLLVTCHLPIIAELASLLIDGHLKSSYPFPCASIMALEAEVPGKGCFDFLWQKNPATN